MKRLLAGLALALAVVAGTARADTFVVLPSAPLQPPSAELPNVEGGIVLPAAFTTPPAVTQQLPFSALLALWQRAGAAYGIPWQVLAAINKLESNFGRNMGPSSAGAVGWMQFMPSTWLRWGMDANGDGVADPWNAEDAVFSAARYLAAAGGRTDLPRAVFAYNHAQWYVDDVLELAGLYGRAGADVAFTLDHLQQRLEEAERDVVEVNRALVVSVRLERRLARAETRLLAQAGDAELLSDRLELHQRAVQVGVRHAAARAEADRLRAELAAAEAGLRAAREGSRAAAFAPGAAALLGAPSYQGGYVFPVGGGPAVVSVGPSHHDYPAADIAAPAGSPLYALADGIVVGARHLPDARCGIGFTLQTGDGLTWTYCHLAYLEPAVEEGVILTAGAPVGLVGSTGHSTGPHLHLQLQPATSYPQEQPWFQAFAGSAFRWQGEPLPAAPAVAAPHPVFAVVAPASSSEPDSGVIAFTR